MKRNFLKCCAAAVVLAMMGAVGGSARAADEVAISVHEMGTDHPLAGVKLTTRAGNARGTYFTAEDGTVKVPMPMDAPYAMVEAASDGWVPVEQIWNRRGTEKRPDHFDLVMEHAAGISGTVVDQAGKPLGGAKVMCVIDKKYPNGQRLGASWTTATADDDGHWSFEGVPEKFDKIQLGAYHRDCLQSDGWYRLDPFADLAGLKNGTAVLKLTRGTPVTIVVHRPGGSPVRNARIGYGEDRVASNVYPEEKTDAQGSLTLGIVPGAEAVITVQMKSYSPELVRVHVGDVPQTIHITLAPGHTLEGDVLDSNGDPAAGATVYIDTWRGARTINRRIKVDAEGHFTWTDAPEDEVKADVLTQNGEKRGVVMKAGQENKVQLTPPTPFKGTVVDAATGQPVTKYTVALGIGFETTQPLNWQMGEQASREVHQEGAAFDVLFTYPYPTRAVRVMADGYLPSDSQRFPMEGKEVDFTFKMEKGKPIHGTALGVDGKPLAGATVVMVTSGNNLQAQNGKIEEWAMRNALSAQTGADGSFSLPPQRDAYALAVATDAGVAQASQAAFEKDPTLKLEAWGRIESLVRHGTKPAAQAQVTVSHQDVWVAGDERKPRVYFFYSGVTDGDGKVAFDRMYPGECYVSEQVVVNNRMSMNVGQSRVTVEAGKTAQVMVGGTGRPVVGKVAVPADIAAGGYQFGFSELRPPVNRMRLLEAYALPPKERGEWYKKWAQTDEGKAAIAEERKNNGQMQQHSIFVKSDGTFEAQGVPEGTYDLQILMTARDNENPWNGKPLGTFSAHVTVPPIPAGVSDEPLDVGTLTMEKMFNGAVGEEEPEVSLKTAGGEAWKLSGQRGKVVVAYLFTTKADEGHAHLAELQAVNDAFGKDPRFTMIGLDIGNDPAALAKYAADHHVAWATGEAGYEATVGLLDRFATNGLPGAWVVGADGKIVARDVTPEKMQAAVEGAMKK